MPRRPQQPALRTDIQGLRAIAVGVVVAYHLAPHALTGGFVGVDVFFVISGFLITTHLLGSPPRGPRDLATFWSRRIRRLLPAALLVLTVVLALSRAVAPETQWSTTASQVRAAALYVVNWVLARNSVDYLAAEQAPSPVQHFWSLSVEEQFYFVWPILILLLVGLAGLMRRRGSVEVDAGRTDRRIEDVTVLAGLGLVVAASLAWSVHLTAVSPAEAYFVTPTRMWELGIGGLLAAAVRMRGERPRPRHGRERGSLLAALLAWVGIAAIAWTAWTYSGGTPFPGWQALVPVLGSALVILARPEHDPRSPGRLLALRPVQWTGDVSYSIYLWHWPLVVLVPAYLGHSLGNRDRLGIVVITLVLAGLTKTYVEDRFRAPAWGRPLRKPYALGALGMACVVALAFVQIGAVQHRLELARADLQRAVSGNHPCFGAGALEPGRHCPRVAFDDVVPAPADAARDKSAAYKDVGGKDCWSYLPDFPTVTCTFGDRHSDVDVALVGNSHGGEWLPALRVLAHRHHWRITTYLASRCAMADVDQTLNTPAQTTTCRHWAKRTARQIAHDRPDLVVMSNRVSAAAVGHKLADSRPAYEKGYASVLHRWGRAGLPVLVLHDTPYPGGDSVPDCVALHTDDFRACGGPREQWVKPDPARTAVERLGDRDVRFLDLTDHICSAKWCAAVTGGVITYFDGSHLSATYIRTLAPYLDGPMRQLVSRR